MQAQARRGHLTLDLTNAGFDANAGLDLFHTKWADADVGITAGSTWKRFAPEAKGVFNLRFW